MKKTKKMLAVILCAGLTMGTITGCSAVDKLKNAITNTDEDTSKKKETTTGVTEIKDAASYLELADYKTVSLKTADIDKQVQSTIDEDLESNVTYKKIKSGKVKTGDTVNIYYVGKIDGVAFDGGSCTKESNPEGFDLEIGSNSFIDGFEDGLIGKKIGETCDVKTTFPESYPANTELQGKVAIFTVTINSKQGKKITPKLTDAFVKKNLSDYTSVEDYKAKTRESVIEKLAVTNVSDNTKVNKYPKTELSAMKKQLSTSIENYLKQQNATLDDYLSSMNTTEKDYNKQIEETAKEELASRLIYNAIAQAEDIEISDDDYQTELKTYLENYSCDSEKDLNEKFEGTYGTTAKSIIYNDLLYDKVADVLVKNVKES